MRSTYVAGPASLGDDEELQLNAMFSTVVGEDDYPGDGKPVDSWPWP